MAESSAARRPKTLTAVNVDDIRDWTELPDDVTASILSRLGAVEILDTAQKVCMTWRRICKQENPNMWHTIHMVRSFGRGDRESYSGICRRAIDLSCGNLVDISIQNFGCDRLLKYITDNSRGIRRLRFAATIDRTTEGLIEAASKLPLLEDLEISICRVRGGSELHLTYREGNTFGCLEVIGNSCPLLKSLKLNMFCKWMDISTCDDDAFAIGETMHGLQHLQLYGNGLTDKGLEAILDGCPRLESLDLRRCLGLDHHWRPDLKTRCFEQIKLLRLPPESLDVSEYRSIRSIFSFWNLFHT